MVPADVVCQSQPEAPQAPTPVGLSFNFSPLCPSTVVGSGTDAVNWGQAPIAAASFWGVSSWAAGITPLDVSHGSRATSPTVEKRTPQPESPRASGSLATSRASTPGAASQSNQPGGTLSVTLTGQVLGPAQLFNWYVPAARHVDGLLSAGSHGASEPSLSVGGNAAVPGVGD